MDTLTKIIPFLIPLVIIQLGLQIFSIIDLIRRKKIRYGNKLIWAAVIVAGSLLGSVVYLILRGDEE